MEIRKPKYKVGDKVVDNQGVVYEILRLEEYSFVHNDYVYLLNDGNYDSEFERYLEPYIWQLVDDNNELSIRLKCLEDE